MRRNLLHIFSSGDVGYTHRITAALQVIKTRGVYDDFTNRHQLAAADNSIRYYDKSP